MFKSKEERVKKLHNYSVRRQELMFKAERVRAVIEELSRPYRIVIAEKQAELKVITDQLDALDVDALSTCFPWVATGTVIPVIKPNIPWQPQAVAERRKRGRPRKNVLVPVVKVSRVAAPVVAAPVVAAPEPVVPEPVVAPASEPVEHALSVLPAPESQPVAEHVVHQHTLPNGWLMTATCRPHIKTAEIWFFCARKPGCETVRLRRKTEAAGVSEMMEMVNSGWYECRNKVA